jgi:hypothetical protein
MFIKIEAVCNMLYGHFSEQPFLAAELLEHLVVS